MEGLNVTLIVKAPNQQIEDQTIRCELTWTIRKLKGYLSEVYPCKPKTEEQKLIYSGQLLSDTVVLKDILRRYEGQDTHTVHLVCASRYNPPSKPITKPTTPPEPVREQNNTQPVNENVTDNAESNNTNNINTSREASNTDGLRRRNIEANDAAASNQANNPNSQYPAHAYYWDSIQAANAWNGAGYAQWASYADAMPSGFNPAGGFNPSMYNAAAGFAPSGFSSSAGFGTAPMGAPMPANVDPVAFSAQMAWLQQMQMQYMQFYAHMMQSAGAMPDGQQLLFNQEDAVDEAEEAADHPDVLAPLEVAALNNGAPELEAWDWLDWFYMVGRIMMIFGIVYLYSSPLRFLIVLISGFMLYLYQIGYFHGLVNNNNIENVNNNNNQPPQNNNNAAEAPVENPEGAPQPEPREEAQQLIPTPPTTPQENQQSFLAVTWTVVTSFLTSLLPETPNTM